MLTALDDLTDSISRSLDRANSALSFAQYPGVALASQNPPLTAVPLLFWPLTTHH